ncbi:GMC oxidoreductase [Breoghania sp. L-A4]|uniref:GMC oxidoreductase n=1 Tax=Breoghania sp. L-A4 TaxID=2304600 RepID=UPI0020C0AD7A|nr:GMC oxidoreductase [Breoghania sp. L-A4]
MNFRYFEEGTDASGEDLASVVEGVKFVHEAAGTIRHLIAEEESPGPRATDDAALSTFVHDNAWGHHASCTCAIGRDGDANAVLDSAFRVRGVTGLRVVDASVFPKIPGFFILCAVFMIAEKAADVILKDRR